MTCHSSSVPMTPISAIQVATPTRQNRRHARGELAEPERRSSTANAAIEATTQATPSTMAASLSAVGDVMKRVSTSMRADSPGCAATSRSVNTPAIWGFFSAARVPVAPGMPTKSAPAPPTSAQMCSVLQAPGGHRGPGCDRGHRVTERDHHDIGVGADEKAVAAGVDAAGRNGGKHQAAGGRQGGDRPARDRDVERLRRPGHQRGGDLR